MKHSILLLLTLASSGLLLGARATSSPDESPGFYNGDDWIALEVDASRLGVRFDASLDAAAVGERIAEMPAVDGSRPVDLRHLAGRTVVLETLPGTGAEAALEAAARIRAMDGVLSASPRFLALEDPYYLTEEILVRWLPGAEEATLATLTADLVQTATLAYSHNPGRVYRVAPGADPLAAANALYESGLAEFALPDFQLHRVTMAGTNDPLYGNQWHLESTGQGGAKVDADIDVEGAWDVTRGDSSVIVAVVDTGVELGHQDLAPNLVQGIDVLDDDNDPQAEDFLFGLITENHSTSVCGVASGRGNNNEGISGVAQQCGIMPIRFLSEWPFTQPTIQDEADAFNFARENGASVVNNSWGPSAAAALPASTKAAIDDCNQNGRGGLGMLIFFAAGNSGANNSGNGYVTYSGTISVTAVNDQEVLSSYSSFGASTDVCAPSNGGVTTGITTTDRLGSIGYSPTDYANDFGGTSSASPCAAGVMLLILSANPSLTRLEALDILRGTAEKVDLAGGNYQGGHSIYYGYGRVNADAAVDAAVAGGGCSLATYCVTSPNSVGSGALIGWSGSASVSANDLELIAGGCPPGKPAIFFYGPQQTQVAFGNGTLCVTGGAFRLPVTQVDPMGVATHALDITDPPNPDGQISSGDTWNFQCWYRDPAAGGSGYNLSDALEVTFCD